MDVSDRRMQVQLTPEAKIAAEFLFYQSDFCVCGLCQRSERGQSARAFAVNPRDHLKSLRKRPYGMRPSPQDRGGGLLCVSRAM